MSEKISIVSESVHQYSTPQQSRSLETKLLKQFPCLNHYVKALDTRFFQALTVTSNKEREKTFRHGKHQSNKITSYIKGRIMEATIAKRCIWKCWLDINCFV